MLCIRLSILFLEFSGAFLVGLFDVDFCGDFKDDFY
jgi:hypothetical protein